MSSEADEVDLCMKTNNSYAGNKRYIHYLALDS